MLDNTYEHFSYAGEAEHSCLEAPHIINVRARRLGASAPAPLCLCTSAPLPLCTSAPLHLCAPAPLRAPAPPAVAPCRAPQVFSFSKAYGMMGWRVGYVAFPPELSLQLLKAQDTIVICPAVVSQKVALGALQPGRAWVDERVVSHARPEP